MAEAVVLGIVVSLLQQGIPAAIVKLRTRFRQATATEGEFRELEDFHRSIQDCYKKYHTGGTVTTTTTTTLTTTATTPSPFAETLNDVQKKLERWSSENCRFFSRSSADRVQKIQALHRKLQRAIQVESFRMTFSIYNRVRNNPGNNDGQTTEISQSQNITIETSTAIDDPHGHNTSTTRVDALTSSQVTSTTTTMDEVESSSQATIITTTTDQVSTHLVMSNITAQPSFTRSRSKSIERTRPSTIPSNGPTFTRLRSKSVQRNRHHSSEKGRTEEFWVPLDSEKQAKDMEKRLKGLPGVKSMFYDPNKKKMWVEVGEGSNVDTDTLLKEIRFAVSEISKYKRVPTCWVDRPDQPISD